MKSPTKTNITEVLPLTVRAIEPMTSATPMNMPERADSRTARGRSPCRAQRTARNTRPPSSGEPGNILNTHKAALRIASQRSTRPISPAIPVIGSVSHPTQLKKLMSALAPGPATAMNPSERGLGASEARRATPPNAHRSMEVVATPKRRATRA